MIMCIVFVRKGIGILPTVTILWVVCFTRFFDSENDLKLHAYLASSLWLLLLFGVTSERLKLNVQKPQNKTARAITGDKYEVR